MPRGTERTAAEIIAIAGWIVVVVLALLLVAGFVFATFFAH